MPVAIFFGTVDCLTFQKEKKTLGYASFHPQKVTTKFLTC